MDLVNLLHVAQEMKASDLHISVGVPPVLRIHGDLKYVGQAVLTKIQTEEIAKQMIQEDKWHDFVEAGEYDFSYGTDDGARYRVNAFYQKGSVSLALRLIPSQIPSLEELHMPPILRTLAETKQGLFLVTGPTGSGKSTTLASMIDYMNKTMRRHIITLEDPIEYIHQHGDSIIAQREVGFDTTSFASGLRAALRQDPDVILVGEMRDLETIHTAITAAETGHLVLATLHTSSAPATIERIIDVFPAGQQAQIRIQLASVLTGILSQRLFQTTDRKGRRAATELMLNNSAVANLIRSEKIHQIPNIMQTSGSQGMHLLSASVQRLAQSGLITREAAKPYLQGSYT